MVSLALKSTMRIKEILKSFRYADCLIMRRLGIDFVTISFMYYGRFYTILVKVSNGQAERNFRSLEQKTDGILSVD